MAFVRGVSFTTMPAYLLGGMMFLKSHRSQSGWTGLAKSFFKSLVMIPALIMAVGGGISIGWNIRNRYTKVLKQNLPAIPLPPIPPTPDQLFYPSHQATQPQGVAKNAGHTVSA